jgi:hypothetical protein
MLGDRCARHSVIVEVESDTDKNIEQLQTNEERMFPAYTQAGKKADRSKMRRQECRKQGLFFSSFRKLSPTELVFPAT